MDYVVRHGLPKNRSFSVKERAATYRLSIGFDEFARAYSIHYSMVFDVSEESLLVIDGVVESVIVVVVVVVVWNSSKPLPFGADRTIPGIRNMSTISQTPTMAIKINPIPTTASAPPNSVRTKIAMADLVLPR